MALPIEMWCLSMPLEFLLSLIRRLGLFRRERLSSPIWAWVLQHLRSLLVLREWGHPIASLVAVALGWVGLVDSEAAESQPV